MNPEFAITLRAKKLGILIKDARLSNGKTMKECGEAIGVSGSTISSYEKGKSSPSLPELEMLSFYLKIPIERFWKDTIIASDEPELDRLEIESPEARNGAWWEVDFIIVLLMASAILGLAAFLA